MENLEPMKQEIIAMVTELKKLEAVTPEILTKLDGYLAAADEDIPRVHEILTGIKTEIDQIEAAANIEMQQLLDQYVIEMKNIQKEVKKLTLTFEESVDRDGDNAKEEELLQQVNQL